jgi:ATP-binding cassette, subfamily B, bacterial
MFLVSRTIINDYPILVLDDTTSALDSKTELEIKKNLKKYRKSKTTITISHRVSSVCELDTILVMDQGQIVESGTHAQLVDLRGLYYTICCLQEKIYDEERVKSVWKILKSKGIGALTQDCGESCLDIPRNINVK